MPTKIQASTIITAHSNADFDALAAMVAASKLYPGAVLIFPGSQERTLRNFFIQSATYMFDFRSVRDIDPASVQTLVLVDTRQRSRLPHVQQFLDRHDIEVHAYDHHPDTEEDHPYVHGIVKPWGSTTAILVQEIRAHNLSLSRDESTLLGLGIYEDTGSFTFNSTTPHDLDAAAWLRQQDMDLNVIADLLNRDLTAEQVAILNNLLESASTHDINGVAVVLAEAVMDRYVGDFALLAHKLLDMENIRVLFALGLMQDRVHVVGRSRTPEVDVGQICASMGGGGHAYAASASVKNRTLAQVKDELFALLYSHINPHILVKDLMSSPAVTVEQTNTIAEAEEVMGRYGLKAVPVLARGTTHCIGVLEHQIANRALAHGLGDIPCAEYMQRDCAVVPPDADLYPVMEIIVGQRQSLVPVVEADAIKGVITRTDLIHTLIEEPARIPETLVPERTRERNIRSILTERLPAPVLALLEQAGRLAQDMGFALYAVGGFVRDILLQQENLDLDLVVEGDGIAFARVLAAKTGGRARTHQKFKTAVVLYDDHRRIDVATARLEYYPYPAALPTVELSSIKMDLFRRDFTINALAVQLNPSQFGMLVDFFGSQRDIKDKVIRVLHSLSFVEDPTRILRAIRFEQRFSFHIDQQSERLIKNAVQLHLFQRLSGSRLFNELVLILEEPKPVSCLIRMQELNILQSIHPLLALTHAKRQLLEEVEKVLHWYRLLYLEPAPKVWMAYILGLCMGDREDEVAEIAKKLGFSKRVEREFLSLRSQISNTARLLVRWDAEPGLKSELATILDPMSLEGLLYLMARSRKEPIRKALSLYLTRLKGLSVDISGEDLLALGIPPGPAIGAAMRRILAAKLDGEAPTRQSQLDFARRLTDT